MNSFQDGKQNIQETSLSAARDKSTPCSPPVVRPKERMLFSTDPHRSDREVQEASNSGRSNSLSPCTERRSGGQKEQKCFKSRHHKWHSERRTEGKDGTKSLEVSPKEETLAPERADMYALEVTHCFFEAVSTQMERWYERKVQEASRQAEQRARADRSTLLERISCLEDELKLLRTSRQEDS